MEESKTWPGNELDGMFAIESAAKNYILPIWLDVDFETVRSYAPLLAGRKAALSKSGIPNIVRDLQIAVDTTTATKAFSAGESPASRLKNHAEEILGAARAKKMIDSPEGMKSMRENLKKQFRSIINEIYEPVFHPNGTPLWISERSESRFTNEQLQNYFMDAVVDAIISVTKGDG